MDRLTERIGGNFSLMAPQLVPARPVGVRLTLARSKRPARLVAWPVTDAMRDRVRMERAALAAAQMREAA